MLGYRSSDGSFINQCCDKESTLTGCYPQPRAVDILSVEVAPGKNRERSLKYNENFYIKKNIIKLTHRMINVIKCINIMHNLCEINITIINLSWETKKEYFLR